VGFNMTPMIDVVFLLIIFFMIVSQVVTSEAELVQLPRPTQSKAGEFRGPRKLTISLVGDGQGGITRRKVGPSIARDEAELASMLMETRRAAREHNERLHVVLRADRSIEFRHVREVISVISDVGLEFVDIAAEAESTHD
jgi:biopolymer transport protein ExbD